MTEKFTKGEWKAGSADTFTLVDEVASKWIYADDKYCAIASGEVGGDWEEVMANAHLIAAAPDMYRALERVTELMEMIVDTPEDQEILDQCLKALAKAKDSK